MNLRRLGLVLLVLAPALMARGEGLPSWEDPEAFAGIQRLLDAGDAEGAARMIGEAKGAAAADPALTSRLANLEAVLAFVRGHAAAAADRFARSVDSSPNAAIRAVNAFNAALAAAQAGDAEAYARYAAIVAGAAGPGSTLPGDLALERGLNEAARSSAIAFEILEGFHREHPEHPRVADAEISLAELYLTQVPAQPVAARDQLEETKQRALTLAQREWLDQVAIWVEVAAGDSRSAVDRALRFLADWPQSRRRPGVLMVLGESYYRMEDFAKAMGFFEKIAAEAPDSEHAEPALFFAARSASLSFLPENQRRAVELWTQVADRGGALSAAARHELGLLELAREEFDAALAAFDAVRASPVADPKLRIAALADQAEALYAKAAVAGNDPASIEAAVAKLSEIQSDPGADRTWRLQAAVRQGKCLEALGKTEEALAIYRRLVQEESPAGSVAAAPVAEFDWLFRAALAAIRLLQAGERWQDAIAIADQVAQAGGPRAAEAARLSESLRLRHFIWEDPAG